MYKILVPGQQICGNSTWDFTWIRSFPCVLFSPSCSCYSSHYT